jgi:hypothetical protein
MKLKHVARSAVAGALVVTAALSSASTATAGPTNHFVLLANKSVILYVCATARDGQGTEVGHSCQTRAAGQKFLFWVPNNATSTRFTAADRGQQMIGVDLANNQDWCYRAPESGNGKVTGPHSPCTPD